jgi:hypothetical protein
MEYNLGDSSGNVVSASRPERFIFKGDKSMLFLTSTGNVITNEYNFMTDEMKKVLLNYHPNQDVGFARRFDHLGAIMWVILKYIKEMPKEYEEDIKKYFIFPSLDLEVDMDFTLSFTFEEIINRKRKQLISNMNELQFFKICMENISERVNIVRDKTGERITIIEKFLKLTKVCRVNTVNVTEDHALSYDKSSLIELNVETFYPLSNSQRRVLLDIIEIYNVPSDRIFLQTHKMGEAPRIELEKIIKKQLCQ